MGIIIIILQIAENKRQQAKLIENIALPVLTDLRYVPVMIALGWKLKQKYSNMNIPIF